MKKVYDPDWTEEELKLAEEFLEGKVKSGEAYVVVNKHSEKVYYGTKNNRPLDIKKYINM